MEHSCASPPGGDNVEVMQARANLCHYVLPPVILLLVVLLLFGRDLFSSGVIGSTYWDTDIDYFLKLRKYAFEQNELFPKWNMLSMCGVPLVAEIQSGLFYPLNIVFLFLPAPQAINITIFIHVYLLSLFTYCFARQIRTSRTGAIVAAIAMSLSAPVVLGIFAGHLSNICTITWIPLILLIIDRLGERFSTKYFLLLAIAFALQVLAGHIQYFFYCVLFSAGFLLFKTFHLVRAREFKQFAICHLGFGLALVLALLLALPQLTPVFEMLSVSARRALSYQEIAQFSFPPQNLLTVFAPTIFGDMINVDYWGVYNLWEMCIYCGTFPILLAVLAVLKDRNQPRVLFFLFAAIMAVLVGLGEHTPVLKILYNIVPGFGLFRGHSKGMIFVCFSIALLAGIGFDSLRNLNRDKTKIFNLLFLCVIAVSLTMLLIVNYSGLYEEFISQMQRAAENDPGHYLPTPGSNNVEFARLVIVGARHSATVFLVLLVIGSLLMFLTRIFGANRLLQVAAITLVCADLVFFASKFVLAVDTKVWDLSPQVLQFLEKDKTVYRAAVLTSRSRGYASASLLHRITGDYPYVLKRYSTFFNLVNLGKPVPGMKIGNIRTISTTYNILNLKYLILHSGKKLHLKGYYRVHDDGDFVIYENKNCLDRAYISHRVRIARDEDSALRYLFEPETASGSQIVLEKDLSNQLKMETNSAVENHRIEETVQITEYRPDFVRMRASMARGGWVCLADTFYPGWQATIDDSINTEILVANYLFRAIYVPQGQHEITLRYSPTNSHISKLLSLFTLIFIIAYFVVMSTWLRKPT